jgi:hypothetical protein
MANFLLNSPISYQDWNSNDDDYQKRKKENIEKENSLEFWESYYSSKKTFSAADIQVYDDLLPNVINDKIIKFKKDIQWKYGYKNDEITLYPNKEQIEEINYFYSDVNKNLFFINLFYKLLLPHLHIEKKEHIEIDRIFVTGQLHGLTSLFHKDERSSIKYGPSVYVLINNCWKSYYDGSLCFLLNNDNLDLYHVENSVNRVIVFPPDMYHKFCEISGYGLFENAFNCVLQYHLIYQ